MTSFAVLDPISYQEESSISLAFSKIFSILLNSAVILLQSTSSAGKVLKHLLVASCKSTSLGTVPYTLCIWLSPGTIPGLCAFLVQLY